ncbi:membrane protein [Gallibacterium genomosp. 3]|uniref:Membrane protein n=1 Tax=Gallibacterium genomosp. 3 TaxID=505345 RepID=A0A1A7PR68_9PAST|nr:LTA synthase family protein [Gallibacterium genomosp. 3]OBX04241.1 membrane protein [Gallibacterium genomosp. 3]
MVEYILLTLFSIASLIFIKNSHYRWTYLFAISLFLFFFGLVLTFTSQWQRALNFANLSFIILMLFHRLKIHYYKQPLLISDFILAFDPRNWETLLHYKSAIVAILGLLGLFIYAIIGFSSVASLGLIGHSLGVIIVLISFGVMFHYSKHPDAIRVWLDSLPDDGRDVFLNLPMSARGVFFHVPKIEGNGEKFQQLMATVEAYPLKSEKPDMVIWLHESTVDPQMFSFQSSHIPVLSMYQTQQDCVLHNLLRVHTFGGATWKSEFAFLSGIPSTDFGAMASSVFYSVAPHTRYSLLKVLKQEGYYCVALSPFTKGNYNAQQAYDCFGFDLFLQPQDLGYPAPISKNLWHIESSDMAKYVQMILEKQHPRLVNIDQPLFVYVLTMREHGPYHAHTENLYQIEDDHFSAHDIGLINDYIQRLVKLDVCMEQFNCYLQQRGKPYLLGYFGDHQPNFEQKKVKYQSVLNQFEYPEYITQFTLRANYQTNPIQINGVLDIAQLGGVLLEVAGLKADPFFKANIAMRKLGGGLQESDTKDQALLRDYQHYLYQQLEIVR